MQGTNIFWCQKMLWCQFLFLTDVCVCVLSHIQLFATPWTVAHQAPLSMEFSRQEYWSGLPFHTPGGLPGPGMESTSLVSSALAGGFFIIVPPGSPFWVMSGFK